MKKRASQKPLTLEVLVDYNQKIFLPALEENLVSKKEFNGLSKEFIEFKDKVLTNEDTIIKKLETLLTEKKVREYREEKENKLWAIIIKSLKEHRILSTEELDEIARLEYF